MKRICFIVFVLCREACLFSQSTISYNEYFDYSRSYCPGDPQYNNWVGFLNSLDTASGKFLSISIRGTYDQAGKTCSDKYVVRQLADAMYNRYDVSLLCDGHYWSVGTGCSDFNCGTSSDYVELTLNQTTCNCGVSYTLRPCITSSTWGGVNTETCQSWSQSANQYMRVELKKIYGLDNVMVASFIPFDECLNSQAVKIRVANAGTNNVGSYMIGYSINGVLQAPVSISASLASDETETVTVLSSYSFTPNTSYQFKVWTYDPNNTADSDPSNDTLSYTYSHTGRPLVPNASHVTSCGVGKVDIMAVSSDSIVWFDEPANGKILGLGQHLLTPFLYYSDTFYAESIKFKNQAHAFGTGFNNYTTLSADPSEYNGGMLKFSVMEVLNISGVKVQNYYGNPSPHYKVYFREGGFEGFETDSNEWTRIFDSEVPNSTTHSLIPMNLVLQPGITYGLYVTTDPSSGEDIWIHYGAYSYQNPDLTVEGGAGLYGKFGAKGVYTPWTLDMEFIYEKSCRSNSRQPVIVKVNPRPFGTEILKGAPFMGRYSIGLPNQPDIGEASKTVTYELTSPSGYDNSAYGVTWVFDTVYISSKYGIPVDPSLYTFTAPDSSGNGRLSFTPDSTLVDSTLVIHVTCGDLGPYFCDTFINRFIHIAPTPKPSFGVISTICEGSEVFFYNYSDVHSGTLSYKWYFSGKDSSDLFQPVHTFDSFGIYPVKLVATSIPYMISSDTTIFININGVPKVDFRVNNACHGDTVTFINTTPGNRSLIRFRWDFGDQTPVSSTIEPIHAYKDPGAYKVLLVADINGCTDSLIKNAYVFPRPVAAFTAPAEPQCLGTDVFFLNNSYINGGKMGAFWEFDDASYSTFFNPTHKYAFYGEFSVRLKMISEFDCADSISRIITIKPAPVVDFNADKLCSRSVTHFENLSTEYADLQSDYTWSFSEGAMQDSKHAVKTWNSSGPKIVKLISKLSNGCSAELQRVYNVLVQPEAEFNTKDICSGENAFFVNTSKIEQGDMDFTWDFGDSSANESVMHPSHPYYTSIMRLYTVRLIASARKGCADTIYKYLKVTELPDCGFSYEPFYLIGPSAFKFIPLNGGYSEYEWFFGDGSTSKTKSPIYQFLYVGNYNVELRAKNSGGCVCKQVIKIKVNLDQDDINDIDFSLYPNPANEFISVTLKESAESAKAVIYNQIGQIMTEAPLGEITEIPTSGLSDGIYTIEIVAGTRKSRARLVIMH